MSFIVKLGFFMFYVIFNLSIVPIYEAQYFSTRIYLYLWIFYYFFTISLILKNTSKKKLKLILIVILSSISLIPIYLKQKDFNYLDYIDLIFISGFFFCYFAIFSPSISKAKNEFEESEYVFGLYDFLFKVLLSKILFILFNRSKIKVSDFKSIQYDVIIGESIEHFFLILSWFYIAQIFVDNKKTMSIIFKSLTGITIIFLSRFIFILLNSNTFNNHIYDLVNLKIPQPHNIILYNICKYPLENKFRVLIGIILYLSH